MMKLLFIIFFDKTAHQQSTEHFVKRLSSNLVKSIESEKSIRKPDKIKRFKSYFHSLLYSI